VEIFDFLWTMKGPEFLVLYFVWFLLLYGAVFFLRRWGLDTRVTTYAGLIPFVAVGVARFYLGSGQGMENFGGLVAMMVLGYVAFHVRRSDSDRGGFYFEGGGGCGSDGGCGGGGCGGCGG